MDFFFEGSFNGYSLSLPFKPLLYIDYSFHRDKYLVYTHAS